MEGESKQLKNQDDTPRELDSEHSSLSAVREISVITKGGENMTTKQLKAAAVSVALTVSAGAFLIAPNAFAVLTNDQLGLTQVENTIQLGSRDIRSTVASIINVMMGLLGIVAVVIILLGGFKWMTAGGDEDKVGEAKQLIMQGIIGLVIILSSWAIARFVVTQLVAATST